MKITMHGNPLTLVGTPIKTGETAPVFYGINQPMQPVSLKEFAGKVVVISSFPSIDTPVCSAQMHHFNKMASELSQDVVILAISCDLPFALHRYCAAEGIDRVVTLSDYKETDFGKKYGFLIEELRLLTRGVVIIGKDNKVNYVEYVPEVMASKPLLPAFVPALSTACSIESVVRIPKITGTPVCNPTWATPLVASLATISK